MKKSIRHWWDYGTLPSKIRNLYWRYRWCIWHGHSWLPPDYSVGIWYGYCEICGKLLDEYCGYKGSRYE